MYSSYSFWCHYSSEYEYSIRTTIRHWSEYEANIQYIPSAYSFDLTIVIHQCLFGFSKIVLTNTVATDICWCWKMIVRWDLGIIQNMLLYRLPWCKSKLIILIINFYNIIYIASEAVLPIPGSLWSNWNLTQVLNDTVGYSKEGHRTIRWQSYLQSVKSWTGQLAD